MGTQLILARLPALSGVRAGLQPPVLGRQSSMPVLHLNSSLESLRDFFIMKLYMYQQSSLLIR